MLSPESRHTLKITCVCVCDSLLREMVSSNLKEVTGHGHSKFSTMQSRSSNNLGFPYLLSTQPFYDHDDPSFYNHDQDKS